MNAIVLFSHGSLLCGAGEALREQAQRLRARGLADAVGIGYLNYTEPFFATTVESLVQQGMRHITVVPYFLVPGKFVRVDLPKAIEIARTSFPEITFEVTEAIGFDMRLADALIDSTDKRFGQEHWRDDLQSATGHCRPNPDCPLFETALCPLAPGTRESPAVAISPDVPEVNADTPSRSPQAWKSPASGVATESRPALLVMVHGSPRPVANEDMFKVVEIVRQRQVFSTVQVGFMECNEPDIPTAIDSCVAQGATQIIAVPYFLHTGTHVADDLPTLIEQGQRRYPDVAFWMGPYLGRSPHLTDILSDRISTSRCQEPV